MTPELKRAAEPGQRRILAIDFGRKRMGLAISDELQLTARPLATLARTNRRNDLRRLREMVRMHGVGKIVVGNPVRLDGSEGEMVREAAQFAARIRKELRILVELFDERLSSWEAQETARVMKPKSKRQDTGIDATAAAIILREFLEREHALDRFGVNRKISSFVMPLGYSFNLDGSMIYTTFAALFVPTLCASSVGTVPCPTSPIRSVPAARASPMSVYGSSGAPPATSGKTVRWPCVAARPSVMSSMRVPPFRGT